MIDGAFLALGAFFAFYTACFLAWRVYLYTRTYVVPSRHVMLVENDGVLRTLPSGRHVLAWNDRVRRCYLTWSSREWADNIDGNTFPLNEIMVKMLSFRVFKGDKLWYAFVDFTFTIDEAHPEIFALKDACGQPMKILLDRIEKTVCAASAASSGHESVLKPGSSALRALETEFGVHIPYFHVDHRPPK